MNVLDKVRDGFGQITEDISNRIEAILSENPNIRDSEIFDTLNKEFNLSDKGEEIKQLIQNKIQEIRDRINSQE